MTAMLTNLNLRCNGFSAETANSWRELMCLTDMDSFLDNIPHIFSVCIPLDMRRIATNKSVWRRAIILAKMADNCSTWARSMISKTGLSTDCSRSTISFVISYISIFGFVSVSNWDAVTDMFDNSFKSWSVLGGHT